MPAPRLLIIGAHPDDAELEAGGLATLYRGLDYPVRMLSVTDGRAGHQSIPGEELVTIRKNEAAAAASVIGAESVVWQFPDGELQPSLELRRAIIAEIRTYRPDLVLTHRPCDYHPDHRAVGQAVQDASYMVTVPKVVPDAPALPRDPVVAYLPDLFTRPTPLRADVVLDVSPHVGTIVAMLAAHASQFYDWLPYNLGIHKQVPPHEPARRKWLAGVYETVARKRATACRAKLVAHYGPTRGQAIEFAEMYEISEYARPLDEVLRKQLFPIN